MTAVRRFSAVLFTWLGALALLASVLLLAQPAAATGDVRFGVDVRADHQPAPAVSQEASQEASAPTPEPQPAEPAATTTAADDPQVAPETGAARAVPKPCDPTTEDCSPGGGGPKPGKAPKPCNPAVQDCGAGLPAVPGVPAPGPIVHKPCDPAVDVCGGTPTRSDDVLPALPELPRQPVDVDAQDTAGGGGSSPVGTRQRPGARGDAPVAGRRAQCAAEQLTCRAVAGSGADTAPGQRVRARAAAEPRSASGVGGAVLARTGLPVLGLASVGVALLTLGLLLNSWRPRRRRTLRPALARRLAALA